MTNEHRILDIELEKLLLGELRGERMAAVERAIETEPEIRARYDLLRSSTEGILAEYPPRVMAAQIRDRHAQGLAEKRRRSPLFMALPAVAAAGAAVLLAVVLFPGTAPPPEQQGETILLKGDRDPELFVFRKRGDREERLKDGTKVNTGDVIQLKYAARGASHGVILSLDGSGTVTLHFPASANGSTALEKGGAHPLGFSYELDDAPGFERFFFVTSQSSLDVKDVLQKARELGPKKTGKLDLPDGVTQTDFLLRKP